MKNLVLAEKTEVVGRGMVQEVGISIPDSVNAPTLTPVRFEDGSHAILLESGRPLEWGGPGSRSLNHAIFKSTKMPEVRASGSGIVHIMVWTKDKVGHIRYHYGFGKEDRKDYIVWV
jgi:hypothetical protein